MMPTEICCANVRTKINVLVESRVDCVTQGQDVVTLHDAACHAHSTLLRKYRPVLQYFLGFWNA